MKTLAVKEVLNQRSLLRAQITSQDLQRGVAMWWWEVFAEDYGKRKIE
jgi:hypothetical protein